MVGQCIVKVDEERTLPDGTTLENRPRTDGLTTCSPFPDVIPLVSMAPDLGQTHAGSGIMATGTAAL